MNDQWLKRWQEGKISFHEGRPNPLLVKNFEALKLPRSTCLVPLCGKAIDMKWLYNQGHSITGIELSDIAIKDFYQEQSISKENPRLQLIQNDFFKVSGLSLFDWAYDRAALIALPQNLRPQYVHHLKKLLKPKATFILISISYQSDSLVGPPYSVSDDEIKELFTFAHHITKIDQRDPIDSTTHLRDKVSYIDESIWRIDF